MPTKYMRTKSESRPRYYTRAMACGLIAEEDEEFGSVVEVPLKHEG